MTNIKRKDILEAKKRGLVSRRTAAAIGSKGRRVCVTCDRFFLDREGSTRIFACGCCGYAYGEPSERDRNIRKGDRVLLVKPGIAGILEKFAKDPTGEVVGVVQLDNGDTVYVRPAEVEKILGLEVKHAVNCSHGTKMPVLKKKKGGEEDASEDADSSSEEPDGSSGSDVVQED